MKVYNKYDEIFKNGELTDLMTMKVNNRNKPIGNNYAVYLLLCDFLNEYGININGAITLQPNNPNNIIQVRHIDITKDFNINNEEVIRQLYGYNNAQVSICLLRDENFELSFLYDLDNYSCILTKWVWGSIKDSKPYDTLKDLLLDINKYKNVLDVFKN